MEDKEKRQVFEMNCPQCGKIIFVEVVENNNKCYFASCECGYVRLEVVKKRKGRGKNV